MRILHIGEYAKGGVATYLEEVINFQQDKFGKDNVYLAVSDYNSESFNFMPNKNIKRYSYKRSLTDLLFLPKKLKIIVESINPDIVHLHSTFAGGAFRLFKKSKKWKVIYTPHGWAFNQETSNWKKNIYALAEKALASRTDIITDISKFEMQTAIERKIDKNKITLIYNGISEKKKKYANPNFVVNKHKINLLFIGRFDKQKGLDILINFFSNYRTDQIDLHVIGESVISKETEFSCPNNVHFIGKVDNSLIDGYIQKVDALIIPSRWEGFGLVAIEAMRNKKPAIVSNRGALPEIALNNRYGYVFDLNDPRTLENVLDNLSKERLFDMGKKSYERFLELFTSEKMNESIVELYQKLLKR